MLISLKARLAYLAMTKTGSTAVEHALRPRCDIAFSGHPTVTHMTARRYQRHIVPYLQAIGQDGIETCAVMRHPVGWLASWYRYRQRAALDGTPDSTAGTGFEDFARRYLDSDDVRATVGRPWDFLRDRQGQLGVDHLFRYEDFGAFLRFLGLRFGAEVRLERMNVSPAGDEALSPAMAERLDAFFEPELAVYHAIRA
jgi:hypothetical protein